MATFEIHPPGGERRESVRLRVDGPGVHAVIPGRVLDRANIRATGTRTVRHGDGGVSVRASAVAVVHLGQRVGVANVLFAEPGEAPCAGWMLLESLGLQFDAESGELRELPMLL